MKEYKAGKVEFRNDDGGIVHAVVGKMSFDADEADREHRGVHQLRAAPEAALGEGQYVKSVAVSATMSPGVRIAV